MNILFLFIKMQNNQTNQTNQNNCQCPCGGGQSCIVDRRTIGDWVQEDDILKQAKLKVRENCYSQPTPKQEKALSIIWSHIN